MKGTRLHLDLFKIFADLARTKSFSKTAQNNHLTQSAISQQMSFLERHFGQKLIERGKGRFGLTPAGAHLLIGSQKMLGAYQETLDRVQEKKDVSGAIKVETVYSIGLYSLALYVKTFLRRYSQVHLHLEYSRSDRIYDAVLRGTSDLGIVAYPWEHPQLEIVPFQREKLVLIGSPDAELAGKKGFRWSDLEQKHFIAFERDIPTRQQVDALLKQKKVFVQVVQEFDNIEILKRTVEIGTGYSILPENTIAQDARNKTLTVIQLPGGPYYRPTGIIYRKDHSLSRAALELIRWMTKT